MNWTSNAYLLSSKRLESVHEQLINLSVDINDLNSLISSYCFIDINEVLSGQTRTSYEERGKLSHLTSQIQFRMTASATGPSVSQCAITRESCRKIREKTKPWLSQLGQDHWPLTRQADGPWEKCEMKWRDLDRLSSAARGVKKKTGDTQSHCVSRHLLRIASR